MTKTFTWPLRSSAARRIRLLDYSRGRRVELVENELPLHIGLLSLSSSRDPLHVMGWMRRRQEPVAVDIIADEFDDAKFSGKGIVGAVEHVEVSLPTSGSARESDGLYFIDPDEVKRHRNRRDGLCVWASSALHSSSLTGALLSGIVIEDIVFDVSDYAGKLSGI
jgi:hypothetical protein